MSSSDDDDDDDDNTSHSHAQHKFSFENCYELEKFIFARSGAYRLPPTYIYFNKLIS